MKFAKLFPFLATSLIYVQKQSMANHIVNSRRIDQGEDVSMLILLPNEVDGIRHLDEKIDTVDFEQLSWSLESEYDVEVQLPRFKMEEELDLKDTLTKASVFYTQCIIVSSFDYNFRFNLKYVCYFQLFLYCILYVFGYTANRSSLQ